MKAWKAPSITSNKIALQTLNFPIRSSIIKSWVARFITLKRHHTSKLIYKSTVKLLPNVSSSTLSCTYISVVAAFCAMERDTMTHQWSFKRHNNSSVFLRELFAILPVLEWIKKHLDLLKISIFSDSLCELLAIYAPRTKNPLVLQIKVKLKSLRHKPHLNHVSALQGIQSNEFADQLSKHATVRSNIDLPVHQSFY